jgi:hypothetical protein
MRPRHAADVVVAFTLGRLVLLRLMVARQLSPRWGKPSGSGRCSVIRSINETVVTEAAAQVTDRCPPRRAKTINTPLRTPNTTPRITLDIVVTSEIEIPLAGLSSDAEEEQPILHSSLARRCVGIHHRICCG